MCIKWDFMQHQRQWEVLVYALTSYKGMTRGAQTFRPNILNSMCYSSHVVCATHDRSWSSRCSSANFGSCHKPIVGLSFGKYNTSWWLLKYHTETVWYPQIDIMWLLWNSHGECGWHDDTILIQLYEIQVKVLWWFYVTSLRNYHLIILHTNI